MSKRSPGSQGLACGSRHPAAGQAHPAAPGPELSAGAGAERGARAGGPLTGPGGRGPSPQPVGALEAAGPLVSPPEPVPWRDVKNQFESESGRAGWGGGPGPRQAAVVTEKAQDLGGSLGRQDVGASGPPNPDSL